MLHHTQKYFLKNKKWLTFFEVRAVECLKAFAALLITISKVRSHGEKKCSELYDEESSQQKDSTSKLIILNSTKLFVSSSSHSKERKKKLFTLQKNLSINFFVSFVKSVWTRDYEIWYSNFVFATTSLCKKCESRQCYQMVVFPQLFTFHVTIVETISYELLLRVFISLRVNIWRTFFIFIRYGVDCNTKTNVSSENCGDKIIERILRK